MKFAFGFNLISLVFIFIYFFNFSQIKPKIKSLITAIRGTTPWARIGHLTLC